MDGVEVTAESVLTLNAKLNGVEWFANCPIESAVGHADTANVLGAPCNRINARLHKGDTAIVVTQLVGGRLLESATPLLEGFAFKLLMVKIK